MPKFSQAPIPTKAPRQKGLAQEVIDEYKPFAEQLEKGSEGTLTFTKEENSNQGRKALIEAGLQLKKYIKVRKLRGQDNVLTFVLVTKKEFDSAKAAAKARGAKLKGKPRAKKAETKAKTKAKAKK